jgi:hypothetical protein
MPKIHEGRKVDEFIIYYVDGNGESQGYEVYGVKQLKSALKWLHSDEVNAISIDVYKRGKNFDNDNDDVIEYYFWRESKKNVGKSLKESTDIFDTLENAWDKSTMNNNIFEKTVLKLKTDSFKDPFDKYSTIYMFADGSSIDCDSLDPFDCEWCTYVSEDLSFVHEFKK